jgi:O-antigen/teichoic acid export membrane protein
MGNSIWVPKIFRPSLEITSFAGWSWLQVLSGVFFHQFDRFLIGAVLGAVPLAAYAACLQIAQQIHALPAALFSFLIASANRCEFDPQQNKKFVISGIVVALMIGMPIIFLAPEILALWMGLGFANDYHIILRVLAGGYMLLSLNVVPHYLNLAIGHARFISVLNLTGGVLTLFLGLWAMNGWGLVGVAASKYAYGCVLLISYFSIRWIGNDL